MPRNKIFSMLLDFAIVSVLLFSLLIGALRGAIRQIAQLIAIAVAYLVAEPIGDALQPQLPRSPLLPMLPQRELATIIAFIAVWLFSTACFGVLIRWRLAGDDLHRRHWDRLAGAWLGGLRTAVSVYVVFCVLGLVGRELRLHSSWLEGSTVYGFAQRHNAFDGHQLFASLERSSDSSSLLRHPPFVELLKTHPELKAVVGRPEMKPVLDRGDAKEILRKLLELSAKEHEQAVDRRFSEL